MREGSLDAPIRHPIPWREADFWDEQKLDQELRRVFDICHGCRRCFNLCDSFPRLLDLIDDSESGELDTVDSKDFKPVIDACTLCDMCFLTKCPYVPPHEFDLDFPHLMLRARAIQAKKGEIPAIERQLTETDRNGGLGCSMAGITNWATRRGNVLTRPLMQAVCGVHKNAELPKFGSPTLLDQAKNNPPGINKDGPAFGKKAVIYATCFANYNNPDIGMAALSVLAKNGVEAEVVYPSCCGMPQLEHGEIARVAQSAEATAAALAPWIAKGYDVIALVPSCALMLKFEWPLIVPDDPAVKGLSEATFDVTEYIVDLAKTSASGLADGMTPLDGGVALHISCHSRAQNMGAKAAAMLRLIPSAASGKDGEDTAPITVIERCSGHGGSWGVMKDNFQVALKIGKPVARKAVQAAAKYVVSECPLAREHILQGMEELDGENKAAGKEGGENKATNTYQHPVQLLAKAYGFQNAET